MTVALYTNIISPHQLPLAREIVRRIGRENYRYIYTDDFHAERTEMGWHCDQADDVRCLRFDFRQQLPENAEARDWLENCDLLLCCPRDLGLIERRCQRGRRTYYVNERWFKPPWEYLRMVVPSFRRMARKFISLVNEYEEFRLLPIGVHACRDFRRLGVASDKMTTWGYFVEPSRYRMPWQKSELPRQTLRVLWVGRMLPLKRVDTLLKAVACCRERFPISLTIVGDGLLRSKLERLAKQMFGSQLNGVHFEHSVSIGKVRELMRSHDVYVLPSNGYEGWGAVVSEALEEGMTVFGTHEAGSCATMLPNSQLFHVGDWRRLACLLEMFHLEPQKFDNGGPFLWTAARAAERLLSCTL